MRNACTLKSEGGSNCLFARYSNMKCRYTVIAFIKIHDLLDRFPEMFLQERFSSKFAVLKTMQGPRISDKNQYSETLLLQVLLSQLFQ